MKNVSDSEKSVRLNLHLRPSDSDFGSDNCESEILTKFERFDRG